jgi:hypothetical protein
MFTFSGSLLLLQCYDLLRYFFGRVLHLTLLFCLLQLDLAEAAALYHRRGRRPVILSDPSLPNPEATVQSGITLHIRLRGLPL